MAGQYWKNSSYFGTSLVGFRFQVVEVIRLALDRLSDLEQLQTEFWIRIQFNSSTGFLLRLGYAQPNPTHSARAKPHLVS
jgi:hypothetical protein